MDGEDPPISEGSEDGQDLGEGLERISFDTDFRIQNSYRLSFSVFSGWRGWRGCFSSSYTYYGIEMNICFAEMRGQLNWRLQKHPLHPLQGLP